VKQFSAVWYLYVFLKLSAIYLAISAVAGAGFVGLVGSSTTPVTMSFLGGINIQIDKTLYVVAVVIWKIITGFATSAALLAISEILRITTNTEAFARATYSVSRRRTAMPRPAPSEETVPITPRRREQTSTPPIFEIRQPTANDLQFSPPERYRRQQLRAQGGPTRRVTVFRNRRDNVVHKPRPAGHVEIVDWLDGDNGGDFRRIPFDKV
jgi:hypothetical protein